MELTDELQISNCWVLLFQKWEIRLIITENWSKPKVICNSSIRIVICCKSHWVFVCFIMMPQLWFIFKSDLKGRLVKFNSIHYCLFFKSVRKMLSFFFTFRTVIIQVSFFVTFQPSKLIDALKALRNFEGELTLKESQLNSLRIDASDLESVRQLKGLLQLYLLAFVLVLCFFILHGMASSYI